LIHIATAVSACIEGKITPRPKVEFRGYAEEAKLCIGDGYIYAFRKPAVAVFFAALLANAIEREVANRNVPEFHFRMGVHSGEVRFFWDPGRQNYNYVGDAINNAHRVLSAVGKDSDDVVYISADIRQELLGAVDEVSETVLRHLENRGRKKDKHDKPHRVYLLNHMAVAKSLLLD
jgi:class 3 adenylate cyclase